VAGAWGGAAGAGAAVSGREVRNRRVTGAVGMFFGGASRARTDDLLVANEALSQAEL
jgi:hypothetical protein